MTYELDVTMVHLFMKHISMLIDDSGLTQRPHEVQETPQRCTEGLRLNCVLFVKLNTELVKLLDQVHIYFMSGPVFSENKMQNLKNQTQQELGDKWKKI